MPICSECSASFSKMDNLKRHIRNVHNGNKTVRSENDSRPGHADIVSKPVDVPSSKNLLQTTPVKLDRVVRSPSFPSEEQSDTAFKAMEKLKGDPEGNASELQNATKEAETFHFRHPFTMIVAGPTSCGKTTWLTAFLQQAQTAIVPPPRKIFWFYKSWQPLYSELKRTVPNIEFLQGVQRMPLILGFIFLTI